MGWVLPQPIEGSGLTLATDPTHSQWEKKVVILRDPYSEIINTIQLLMSGGSTQDVGALPQKEVGAGHLLSVPASSLN